MNHRKYTPEEQLVVEEFRNAGRCELCGRPGPTDCCHVYTHGSGAPTVRQNLFAACRHCHSLQGSGYPRREVIVAYVERREGMEPGELEALVYAHRRWPRPLGEDVPF